MVGTTDEIKARLNIVELVGAYVRLEKAGSRWKARCPFHQERTPSFMVNEERGMWHCFGCGKGGDVFAFVMEIEALDFREALQLLAQKAGVELPQYRGEEKEKENKNRIFELLELATKFYEKQLWEGAGKTKILAYLHERGLTDESLKKFRLGYAPDGWRHALDFLKGRGFSFQEMENAGLVIRRASEKIPNSKLQTPNSEGYDRFRDRIMFPIFDILGRVIGYSARVAPGGDETQAKYINTPETSVYHKSRVLYGLFQAKTAMKQSGVTVVVEGNTDVIALHQAGVENTVAVSGTALTPEQLSIIKRYGEEVRLFFDMDAAGAQATRASAEHAFQNDLIVSLISLPFGKDAAEMGKADPEALKRSVARHVPALEFFLKTLLERYDGKTALGKRKIVEEYTALLASVHNTIERAHFVRQMAQAVDMDEKTVTGIVNAGLLHRERREGPALRPKPAPGGAKVFGTRAERLREELMGLCYADALIRKTLLPKIEKEKEILAFFEKHPLFFFLRQAGDREPAMLIEDLPLKSEAARLVFNILEMPAIKEIPADEQSAARLHSGEEYLRALRGEVSRKEKMRELERAIRGAREKKDTALEKKLLREFTELSLSKDGALSSEEETC